MKFGESIAIGALGVSLLTGCGGSTQERDWREDLTQQDLLDTQGSVTLAVGAYEAYKAKLDPACAEAVEPYLFGGAYESAPTSLATVAVQAACAESPYAVTESRALHGETMRLLNLLQDVRANVSSSDD